MGKGKRIRKAVNYYTEGKFLIHMIAARIMVPRKC